MSHLKHASPTCSLNIEFSLHISRIIIYISLFNRPFTFRPYSPYNNAMRISKNVSGRNFKSLKLTNVIQITTTTTTTKKPFETNHLIIFHFTIFIIIFKHLNYMLITLTLSGYRIWVPHIKYGASILFMPWPYNLYFQTSNHDMLFNN